MLRFAPWYSLRVVTAVLNNCHDDSSFFPQNFATSWIYDSLRTSALHRGTSHVDGKNLTTTADISETVQDGM